VSASPSTSAKVGIGSQHVVALGSNGTVWTWGSLVPGPTGVGSKDSLSKPTQVTLAGGRTVIDIAATYNASFAPAMLNPYS
jgi:alpha-tubulin suppressor-like RCC1 family protein